MSVPDEAVEAAAKAASKDDAEPNWYLETERFRNTWRIRMRAALEAAAPILMSEAWDEGVNDGTWNAEHHFQIANGTRQEIENPYRSAV